MIWSREQYISLMTFNHPERPMLKSIFGTLVGLAGEWRAQGASEEEISLQAFDFDAVETVHCGGDTGVFGGPEPCVLERTDEYVIQRDRYGRTTKLFTKSATIPLPLDHPVTDMDSWRRVKHWFAYDERRIDRDEVEAAKAARNRGALVTAHLPGGFDLPRQLMGEEKACLCYYDDPELMHDILDTAGETAFRVLDRISGELAIDCLCTGEDLAGKSGPLVGPNLIREFIRPYYRRVWDVLASRGAKLFTQDSDGNLNAVVDSFLDCGVNIMYPMEPAAGMDIVALRGKYGRRLALEGGIDKHVLRQDKADILRELTYKLQPCMREGGTAFALDHRVTNGTPIENYRYYVDTAREILGLPPRKGCVR